MQEKLDSAQRELFMAWKHSNLSKAFNLQGVGPLSPQNTDGLCLRQLWQGTPAYPCHTSLECTFPSKYPKCCIFDAQAAHQLTNPAPAMLQQNAQTT